MLYQCEYTDTYGGEANYSWCKRATIDVSDGESDRAIVQRAKKELGLTGLRCKRTLHGPDVIELHPVGECTVIFIYPII